MDTLFDHAVQIAYEESIEDNLNDSISLINELSNFELLELLSHALERRLSQCA